MTSLSALSVQLQQMKTLLSRHHLFLQRCLLLFPRPAIYRNKRIDFKSDAGVNAFSPWIEIPETLLRRLQMPEL